MLCGAPSGSSECAYGCRCIRGPVGADADARRVALTFLVEDAVCIRFCSCSLLCCACRRVAKFWIVDVRIIRVWRSEARCLGRCPVRDEACALDFGGDEEYYAELAEAGLHRFSWLGGRVQECLSFAA